MFQTPLHVNKLNYYHDAGQEDKANQEQRKLIEAIELEIQDGADAPPAKSFPSVGFLQKLSEAAYEKSCTLQKPWLQLKDIYCKDNTMRARIFINTDDRQLVIAFKGTNKFSRGDLSTDKKCVLKGKPANKHCNSAATVGAIAREFLEQFHGRMHLIITGHSLGGYLAQLAAFAAQNLHIVDGEFKTVDPDKCIEIYPHTVVFDSPAAAERILQSTFVNPVSIESLRLDVTNYIKCGNMVNHYSEQTRHLGRMIYVKSDSLNPLKFNYWRMNHSIHLFGSVDCDDKCEVVDLNNLITEPLDEFSIPSMAFSKNEYDALQILPVLKTFPSKTELKLNFNLNRDSIQIFNEKPDIFVPRMRLFLLNNKELLKDYVKKIRNFQVLIVNELWQTLYPDFQDLNISLKLEYTQALLGAESDVHIKCDKPLKEKILMAQMIRNSIPNTYYLSYKHYKEFSTELFHYFIANFKGHLILLLENNETFEAREEETTKTCKFIIFSNNAGTTEIKLKSLERAKVEIVSKESRSLIENKKVDFFGNSISVKELFKVLPNDVDLIEILEFVLSHSQIDSATASLQLYVEQRLVSVLQDKPHTTFTKSIDDLISLLTVKESFFILSSGPGMGKTTFFTHLQAKLTNDLPNYWIVKISLLDQSQYLNGLLQKTGKLNINHVVEFITQSQQNGRTAFQMKVLEYLIKIRRVVVIIDAFDEICPLYRKTALQIIAKLKSSKIGFAVSTRPQELEKIQKKLKSKEHFELLEIQDLGEFFKQYFIFKENFKTDEAQKKADSLNQFSHCSNNDFGGIRLHSFWRIPLHALMVAELYAKSESSINMNNLSGLFDQFVEKRICRDLKEKMNLDPTHPKQSQDFDIKKKGILESLMQLAMRENFTDYQAPRVVNVAAIRKNHEKDINYTGIATIVNSKTVKFSHHTFAEYLGMKFCLAKMKDKRVLNVIVQVLLESAHWMKRKFLNEMATEYVWPGLGTLMQEHSDEVLVRICKDNLVEIFRLLRRSGVSFDYDNAHRVVLSQETLWDKYDLPTPKQASIDNEVNDYDDYDDDDDDEYVLEDSFGHIATFPLSLAIKHARENLVLELINDGADLSRVLNDSFSNYEDILSHAIIQNMPNVVKQILEIRPLINETDYEQLCMINWAVRADSLELVQILYEAGASLSASDANGTAPLHVAKKLKCSQQIIQFLNEHLEPTQPPDAMENLQFGLISLRL